MKNNTLRATALAVAWLLSSAAGAQAVATIDFKSVGRAASLLVDINKQEITGAAIQRSFGQPPAANEGQFIGMARTGYRLGSSRCPSTCSPPKISTRIARSGPIRATSAATAPSRSRTCGAHARHDRRQRPATAAWGYCDRDYPREAIVSPYAFKTAQEHYEALLAETTKRGGPTQHTYADRARRMDRPLRARAHADNANWYRMRHDADADRCCRC